MKKKIFFYLFLVCAGKAPVMLHAQQNEHGVKEEQGEQRIHLEGEVPVDDKEDDNQQVHEEPIGYDALDHAFEACEAQPKPRFTMPEWIVSLGITLAIKYFEVQDFVGEKWQRLKELLRKKRAHGKTIKA